MVFANGQSSGTIVLFFSEQPAWALEASAHLGRSDFYPNLVNSTTAAWTALERQTPDAILTGVSCQAGIELFQTLITTADAPARPLLIMVCDQPPAAGQHLAADIFLPVLPDHLLEHQLRTLLSLRASHDQLTHDNARILSDNQRLRHQLEAHQHATDELNMLKTAIVRTVAHELKTPLLQVKSAVALLAEDAGKTQTLLDYATGATARLEAVVRNITLLNELLNESLEYRSLNPMPLRDVVEYALRNLRRSWEHKDRLDRIRLQIPADLPPVLADRQGFGIALQLLLDNALKFSDQQVDVIATRNGDTIHVAVRDYGIGIASDKIGKIFDAFYQVDSSSTRRYGGMGIGLAIVRFIFDRHQITVHVESRENKGSTFSIQLTAALVPTG